MILNDIFIEIQTHFSSSYELIMHMKKQGLEKDIENDTFK